MSFATYLYFEGNCAAAFDHYLQTFEAAEICRQFYSDGPAELFENARPEWIMHTSIMLGDSTLMGADRVPCPDSPLVECNNFAVMYKPATIEEAEGRFEKLAVDGTVTMPLQETFWGSYFGMCKDRYGINWIFNCALSNSPSQ
ncbi:MAG: VOC family protein [Planctomycetota bacterium]